MLKTTHRQRTVNGVLLQDVSHVSILYHRFPGFCCHLKVSVERLQVFAILAPPCGLLCRSIFGTLGRSAMKSVSHFNGQITLIWS